MVFTKKDFDIFAIPSLEGRMKAIRSELQPKFKIYGKELEEYLSKKTGINLSLHIAQHIRRSVNPPKDTWLAIASSKRGYKQHPHFQLGLYDDHVFLWLAFIYEMPNKKEVAKILLDNIEIIENLPKKFVISQNHMKKDAISVKEADIKSSLVRFHDVKQSEFLLGVKIDRDDEILLDDKKFIKEVEKIYTKLLPLYLATIIAN